MRNIFWQIKEISEYETYEMECHSKYNRITIEGKTVGCSRCVGYCKYDEHPGFLTEDLRKQHECCKKGCNYYVEKTQKNKEDQPMEEDETQSILQAAINATTEFEGMRVVNVSEYNDTQCIIRYATLSNSYPIKDVENILSDAFGINVHMKKIECDLEVAEKLIFPN